MLMPVKKPTASQFEFKPGKDERPFVFVHQNRARICGDCDVKRIGPCTNPDCHKKQG